MLGSSHDSERAAAALKATEFLKARNLTWEEFIRQINSGRKPDRRPHWSEGPRTDAEWCRALKEALYQLPVRLGARPARHIDGGSRVHCQPIIGWNSGLVAQSLDGLG